IAEDAEHLPIDQLADDLIELETVSGLIEAIRVDRIGIFERRAGHRAHGYPSMTDFLKHRCRMAAGRARRLVAAAHARRIAPRVFTAWLRTRISTDQAHRLFETATAVPDEFPAAEETLTDAVADLSHADTRRALAYWRQSVDGPGTAQDAIQQKEMRGISASESLGGMLRVDGWMTRLAGRALLTALDALMPPPAPDDTRTPRQRRHDALEDLARGFLEHGQTPTVGGEKPHINVVCDLPALQGIAGGLHQTETGQVLTIAELRTLTCDCSLSRIVFGPNSEIIDVGRRTRVIPAAMRRAVIARDLHCTWEGGCDRDARWCDVHHIQHWADLGETEPCNL
ncbi:MAG: DUF222 domain-containing protein, partial [Acidimicrobiia bacterium]